MQITRETIALETHFVFDSDSCDGCGSKLGYDLFIFDSGISINGMVKTKQDEVKGNELIDELKKLVVVTDEQLQQMQESEQRAIFERTDTIIQKLSDMGVEVTKPEFHLLVYYGRDYVESKLAKDFESVEPNGRAYVKLIMIEELPDSIRYAQMFQGTCNDTEQLKLVYDMCINGCRNDIITKEEIESGEPLPFDHHDN